jgi:hypothetical protein
LPIKNEEWNESKPMEICIYILLKVTANKKNEEWNESKALKIIAFSVSSISNSFVRTR